MPRATDNDVLAYVEVEDGTDLSVYINSASVITDGLLASSGLSEALLTQIEIFLAAHFTVLAVERGGLRRDTMGESSQAYQTISERLTGFNLTRFGQQAILLDTTKTLVSASNNKLAALFRVVGDASPTQAS